MKEKKWNDLNEELQNAIKKRKVKRTDENIGTYMNEDDYTKGTYYVDDNDELITYSDYNKLKSESNQELKSEPFDWLTKPLEDWVESNPLFSYQRVLNMRKALDKNPNFMDSWRVAENAMEGVNILSGGILPRLSPTQNLRMLIDWKNGKPIFTDENGLLGSWWGNNGAVSDDFAKEHPYISMIVNGVGDGALHWFGKSVGQNLANEAKDFYKWGTTYKPLDFEPGAEFQEFYQVPFFKSPFRKRILKIGSTSPEQMAEKNSFPETIPSKYVGQTSDGRYMYVLNKAIVPDEMPNLHERAKLYGRIMSEGGKPLMYDNFLKMLDFYKDGKFITDLGKGNLAYKNWFDKYLHRLSILDPGVPLDEEDYFSIYFKKGGKIKEKNKFIKHQEGGVFNSPRFVDYVPNLVTPTIIPFNDFNYHLEDDFEFPIPIRLSRDDLYIEEQPDQTETKIKTKTKSSLASKPKLITRSNQNNTSTTKDPTPSSNGKESFLQALAQAEREDPNVSKYRNFLIATAYRESTFRSNPKSPTGKHFGYFGINTDAIRKLSGVSVDLFRNNPVVQIKTAAKLCSQFLKETLNSGAYQLGKQKGYSDSLLLAGAWLSGAGGLKRFLEGKGNPSDSKWFKSGGDNVAKRMKDFSNV